jgi:hypothetical protein
MDRTVGGGVGKILHWGRLPVNLQLAGYYNVATPNYGANCQIRTQVQFLRRYSSYFRSREFSAL